MEPARPLKEQRTPVDIAETEAPLRSSHHRSQFDSQRPTLEKISAESEPAQTVRVPAQSFFHAAVDLPEDRTPSSATASPSTQLDTLMNQGAICWGDVGATIPQLEIHLRYLMHLLAALRRIHTNLVALPHERVHGAVCEAATYWTRDGKLVLVAPHEARELQPHKYKAPEVLSDAALDQQADLYAVGAMLERLLHHPQLRFPPDPKARALLDEVARTALARAPDKRWQSAGQFARALNEAACGHIAAPPELAKALERFFSMSPEEQDRETTPMVEPYAQQPTRAASAISHGPPSSQTRSHTRAKAQPQPVWQAAGLVIVVLAILAAAVWWAVNHLRRPEPLVLVVPSPVTMHEVAHFMSG